MNPSVFDEAGFSRLHTIYHNESTPPLPSPSQRREIGSILAAADVTDDPAVLRRTVGFHDEVTLTSATDPHDDFTLRVVMPREADSSQGSVSILMPVSLAIIGRREGDMVSWEANGSARRMKISSVRKTGYSKANPEIRKIPEINITENINKKDIMNHDASSPAIVRLVDGNSPLGEWTHQFDNLPAIGEKLHIEDVGGDAPAGYGDRAPVVRIDRDLRNGQTSVILEAVPASAKGLRNVVFLNANYIPGTLQRDVEEFVRGHVDLPVFEWVRSQRPAPIVELRGPVPVCRPALGQLQAKIRALLDEASPLAVI